MLRLALAALAIVALSGCDRFPGLPANETGTLSYDWIPADPRPSPKPLYCYATLASPECFAQPVPGRQLLGLYGKPPVPQPQWEGNPPPPGTVTPAAMMPPPMAPDPAVQASEPPPPVPVTPVERAPLLLVPAPKS